ncbi:MAG: hypothetical protein M1822_001120 [Bathelium mastoideum]|nr:MAG: hypothetical protein M1822_001120 [Bathelium mastoideum]
MRDTWLRTFRGPPSLRTLVVEYETLTWKKQQMEPIIARNKQFKLPIYSEPSATGMLEAEGDNQPIGYLSAENTKLEEWKWKGPSKLDGKTWNHHGEGETMEYVVVVDRWEFTEVQMQRGAALHVDDTDEDEEAWDSDF